MSQEILENVKLNFIAEGLTVTESTDKQWLNIGGTALTEGISRNKNKYRFENLKENDGREFKWLVGHPKEPEEHIVGKGKLMIEGDRLVHTGKVRNTIRHPEVIESVKDKFWGPSIHATANKLIREGDSYLVEGLSIDAVGFVAFQGVKDASIEYAIAESFKLNDMVESTKDKKNNNDEVLIMEEEVKKPEEAPVKEPEPAAEEVKKAEESVSMDEFNALKKELADVKESNKLSLVEEIVGVNKELVKEDLMKESVDKLNLIKEYEIKLSGKSNEVAVVEHEESPDKVNEDFKVEGDGLLTMSKALYEQFNKELRERIR